MRGDRCRRRGEWPRRRQPRNLRNDLCAQRQRGSRSARRGGRLLRLDRWVAAARLHAELHERDRLGAGADRPGP